MASGWGGEGVAELILVIMLIAILLVLLLPKVASQEVFCSVSDTPLDDERASAKFKALPRLMKYVLEGRIFVVGSWQGAS